VEAGVGAGEELALAEAAGAGEAGGAVEAGDEAAAGCGEKVETTERYSSELRCVKNELRSLSLVASSCQRRAA
jgi:hypothetical protein